MISSHHCQLLKEIDASLGLISSTFENYHRMQSNCHDTLFPFRNKRLAKSWAFSSSKTWFSCFCCHSKFLILTCGKIWYAAIINTRLKFTSDYRNGSCSAGYGKLYLRRFLIKKIAVCKRGSCHSHKEAVNANSI